MSCSTRSVVQGAVDVLRETLGLPDAARRPLERIARSTSLMNEISHALLTLARTDSERWRRNTFRGRGTGGRFVDNHRELLHGKPVALEIRVTESLTVSSERATLRILLGNLIRNACSTPIGVTSTSRSMRVE